MVLTICLSLYGIFTDIADLATVLECVGHFAVPCMSFGAVSHLSLRAQMPQCVTLCVAR